MTIAQAVPPSATRAVDTFLDNGILGALAVLLALALVVLARQIVKQWGEFKAEKAAQQTQLNDYLDRVAKVRAEYEQRFDNRDREWRAALKENVIEMKAAIADLNRRKLD